MTAVLQVGDRAITAEKIVPLLAGYQLLPRLLFELIRPLAKVGQTNPVFVRRSS
jgi:hypothetical protein